MSYAVNQVFADESKPLKVIENRPIVAIIRNDELKIKNLDQVVGNAEGTNIDVIQISEETLETTTSAAIQVDIPPGMVEKNTEVNLITTSTGASIYFTLNGREPVPNTTGTSIWLEPMKIKNDTSINARVYNEGQSISELYRFDYLVQNAISLNITSEKPSYKGGEVAKINLEIANRKSDKEDVTLVIIQRDESGKILEKTSTTQSIKSMSKSNFEIKTKVLEGAKELNCYIIDNLQNQKLLEEEVVLTVE